MTIKVSETGIGYDPDVAVVMRLTDSPEYHYSATYAVPGSKWFTQLPPMARSSFCDFSRADECYRIREADFPEPALEFGQIDRVTDRLRLTTRDGKVYSKLCRLRDAFYRCQQCGQSWMDDGCGVHTCK